jgi:hypothetical protein
MTLDQALSYAGYHRGLMERMGGVRGVPPAQACGDAERLRLQSARCA